MSIVQVLISILAIAFLVYRAGGMLLFLYLSSKERGHRLIGSQFRLSELMVMVFLCGLAMFGMRHFFKDLQWLEQSTFVSVFLLLLISVFIIVGCNFGMHWVARCKMENGWHRMGIMLLGAVLPVAALCTIVCFATIGSLDQMSISGILIRGTVIIGSFLLYLLGWAVEQKARRNEGTSAEIILPPDSAVLPAAERHQSPDSDPQQNSQKV